MTAGLEAHANEWTVASRVAAKLGPATGDDVEAIMGQASEPDDAAAEWRDLVELSETHDELGDVAGTLKQGGPPPPPGPSPLARAPMILDTDLGGDPDDAVALTAAALTLPELALVVTCDEYGGERARFARHLLDLAGRQDVPVVRGSDLGNTRLFCVEGVTPADVPEQKGDLVAAVESVCEATGGPVRWVGMGPMSNLTALLTDRPDLVARMTVTQMGGALAYRDPTRAEHNFRVDPQAAIRAVHALEPLTLVVSDVTFTTAIELTADSPLYQRWTAPDAPAWARLLATHLERWMTTYPGSMQHDGLTLAAALLWPGIRFAPERVALDEQARMHRADDGVQIRMSIAADYDDFMSWLATRLTR